MPSSTQRENASQVVGADEQFSPGGDTDEAALSPESRKVLKKCAVPIAPVSNKESRTIISRPMSSGVDMGGFHFAKPAYNVPKFTARPQPRPSGTNTTQECRPEGAQKEDESLQASSQQTKNNAPSKRPSPQNPVNRDNPATRTSDGNIEDHAPSDVAQKSVQKLQSGPTEIAPADCQTEPSEKQREHTAAEDSPAIRVGPRPRPPSEHPHVPPGIDINSGTLNTQPSKVSSPSYQANSLSTQERWEQGHTSQEPSIQTNPPPAFRVTKHRNYNRGCVAKAPPSAKISPASTSQPSEEDLFYMLIHKMKRRDEAEAAEAALKEQMTGDLRKADEENKLLTVQLKQAMERSSKQEAELTAQRSLIERWKAKFNKLKSLVSGIVEDQEAIRKDGQRMKAVQGSLKEEKEQISTDIKAINDVSETMREKTNQQMRQLSSFRSEVTALEKSVALAEAKIERREQALAREKSQVATLEGFIKSSSDKHQRQAASIQRKQSEAVSKIDNIYKYIGDRSKESQSAMKAEIGSILNSNTETLEALREGQSVDQAELKQINASIKEFQLQLNSHRDMICKTLERSAGEEGKHDSEMIDRLREVEKAFHSASKAADQVAEIRELNGRLHEKLNIAESALAQSNIDRDNLRWNEATLKEQISGLQTEIVALKEEIGRQAHGGTDATSELQIQLDATSSTLTEATENIKTKENEIWSLKSEVESAKASLESSEILVATLEAEKSQIQEHARGVEQKVREELTRASLKSKDQSRALFEQEQHRLKREKKLVEKEVQKFKEQLEATKRSLVEAKKARDELVTTTTNQQKEIDQLKDEDTRKSCEMDKRLTSLEEQHMVCLKEKEDVKSQLDAAQKEKEQSNLEVSRMQATMESENQMDLLQERFDFLQDECADKDESLASLRIQLDKFHEEEAKRTSNIEKKEAEHSAEIERLKKQIEGDQQANGEISNCLKQKEQEIVSLTEQLKAFENDSEKVSNLQLTVQGKEKEISQLEHRTQEADFWSTKIECLLKNLGIVDPQGSLPTCWDLLESRLTRMVDQTKQGQTPQVEENSGPNEKGPAQRGNQKRTALSTPMAGRTNPQVSTQEYHTTEVFYRQHSVRESKSVSPRKRESEIHIKPFSHVQRDPIIQAQSSPLSQLTDLSSMFPASPTNEKKEIGPKPSVSSEQQCSDKTQSQSKVTAPQRRQKRARLETPSQFTDHRVEHELQLAEGQRKRQFPLQARDTNTLGTSSQKSRKGETVAEGNVKVCLPSEPKGNSVGSFPQSDSQDAGQNQGRKIHPKGILKDTTVASYPAGEPTLTHTPKGEQKTGRQRRQSRTSSAYFDKHSDPARSGASVGSKQATDDAVPQTRPKARRRSKGDRYNDRFSQGIV